MVRMVRIVRALEIINNQYKKIMYKFTLEPYRGLDSRYTCPECGRHKAFVRYIDSETKKGIAPEVGRCNREIKCGYYLTPSQYFGEHLEFLNTQGPKSYNKPRPVPEKITIPFSSIPGGYLTQSLNNYESNEFVLYLSKLFGIELTNLLVTQYLIGTSDYWNGASIFWQVDINKRIRAGKIMLYDSIAGKRVKEPYNHINWVHSVMKMENFTLVQSFFGEHLLNISPDKPVAIVESEKTAVIASVYIPQYIWIAVGSLSNLSMEKCQVLRGRCITLFPDLNGYGKWKLKAVELSKIAWVNVSNLLELKASIEEKEKGLDLADYLVRFSYKDFTIIEEPEIKNIQQPKSIKRIIERRRIASHRRTLDIIENNSMLKELEELEQFFKVATIPENHVKLDNCTIITDTSKFLESHFAFIKAHDGQPGCVIFLIRLKKLKEILSGNIENQEINSNK